VKLRTHLNLIVAGLSAVLLSFLVWAQIDATRSTIKEEMEAANRVATQVLSRVAWTYSNAGPAPLLVFLNQLGRVRANNIMLRSSAGQVLYVSPPPTYKAGREAPAWFARMLVTEPAIRVFALEDGGRLVVEADASRAVLDGWDDLTRLLIVGAILVIMANALAFWSVGRALEPFPVIADGLRRIQEGDLAYRLPPLRGHESSVMASEFNRMAQAVENNVQAERKAREAEARLEERSEMARVVEQRLEEERRLIAHELHDELGQSVTAIRSLALAITNQSGVNDARTSEAARLIAEEAAGLYDAMHGLIPRLAPLLLDTLGLADTLENLVKDWRRRHPATELVLEHDLPADLGPSLALTLYRIVQEGLINALRHAQASRVQIDLHSDAERVRVTITDDGVGLPADWSRPGHFGLRGLKERVASLGGELTVTNDQGRGVRLAAEIPLAVGT
jgi:two-component system, NarL family, sensor histidine kinase UhpB